MNTLKEILVDAARYRWLRENLSEQAWKFVPHPGCPETTPDSVDRFIDEALSGDN